MNHETYVSLETAKLLKQAGFDWETRYVFSVYGLHSFNVVQNWNDWQKTGRGLYSAPSLSVVQKWLREVKDCEVQVTWGVRLSRSNEWETRKDRNYSAGICCNGTLCMDTEDFQTYESALEAGIKKCLILIIEKDETITKQFYNSGAVKDAIRVRSTC